MGSHRLTATGPGTDRATRNLNISRGARAALAGALALGLAMSGSVSAMAATGGGGVGGGGGGGGTAADYWLFTGDNYDGVNTPPQGWGQTSIDYFASSMEQGGTNRWADGVGGDRTGINQACTSAIDQAIARSNGTSNRARVIQVGVAVDWIGSQAYMGWGGGQTEMQTWYQGLTNTNYWQGNLSGYDQPLLDNVYNAFMANIVPQPRIVCVAMNSDEGGPRNYDLAIDTDKSGTFALAGSSATVSDRINASTSSTIRENINAVVTLKWGGVEGNAKQSVKNSTIANSGTTNSVGFTPSDFGWASWPSGKFWFDVSVAKQGKMNNAVSHNGGNDPRENWTAGTTPPRKVLTSGAASDVMADDEVLTSGMFYNAQITARTNGYASSMTITDSVNGAEVFIGNATMDESLAPYINDPNGNKVVGASVEIYRPIGAGASTTVKVVGTVTNIPDAFQAREYTLVVPTYVLPTKADYTITDDSSVCYTAAKSNCIAGNSKQTRKVTPAPDKVWVLDQNGALAESDPAQTNQAGADNKVFAPGAAIGAVVNGSIPAKLAEDMSAYSITDDWTGAAKYIDFSDASKAKVFLNGAEVTSQFTITVSGTTTIATAKAAFLANTKGLAQERSVKLYIAGTFKKDYDTDGNLAKLTNTGSETWNNETVDTNTPAIYTITPAPDKVWVLNEAGALSTADPSQANTAGVDNKTFAPGATISAVVNGSVPSNLGSALSSYEIADDWTAAAKYIDFTDASKAKVFLDGVNVTNQFDVSVNGTKTVATAKAAFLNNTLDRSTGGTVKLYVAGSFKLNYDTDGKLDRLTNAGWEKWNGKSVATNTPAIFTVTPDPDKAWVLDEKGALTTSDASQTNTAGVDTKTFAPGAAISAVVNGSVPANLGAKLNSYVITDDWTNASQYVDFSDVSKAKVFLDGANVTSQFDIVVSGTKTTATAKATFLNNTLNRATEGTVKLLISGQFRNDYDTSGALSQLTNAGAESWNGKSVDTNVPAIFTITPTPDKVWVLDEQGGLASSDKDWSNTDGSDNKVFLQNDAVAAVVNGSIPANLGSPLYNYTITDNWTAAAAYVDFSQAALAKVFYNGLDVTDQFNVQVQGTTTVATANAGFLAATVGLAAEGKVKLIISGYFRADYDTNGEIVTLTNAGAETWNNRTQLTNEPPVYTWTPNPNKQVLGSAAESGSKAHDDINGASVWPGQKLEYSVGIDLRVPANTARGIKSLAVEDVYDPYLSPDKTSVEFWDSRNPMNPRPVARSAYKLTFDKVAHTFTAAFTQEWIDANVGEDGANSQWLSNGWLTMRFTGLVSAAIPAGSTVVNQAFQIINGARTATEIPVVEIPTVTPDKDSLSTDLINIDGKTVVEGDVILYRLTMDGGPIRDKLAYNVHKFGMVDDYDQDYLKLEESDITVTEKDTGLDVTGKFNVQVKDGVAYVFAKQTDTEDAYGETIAGDPQPTDLGVYDQTTIRPLEDPIIDQALLGKNYWVTLRTTVTKEKDGYVIQNQARQNIQNTQYTTKIVSNPLKEIDPTKDVIVSEETKGDSINAAEVKMNAVFNYRLNTSEIPADRAYKASQWSMSDTFDRVHDQYTGIWAVYANFDIYENGKLIFKKGDLLQDSAGHESEPWNDLFAVTFDKDTYTFQIDATQKYLDLVETRGDLANSFSAYTKMVRIAPSEKVENKVTESYNKFARESNIVWTFTNENPGIAVDKFTLSEGSTDGDRADVRLAYEMTTDDLTNGVEVGIRFSNTGDVPLRDVKFADITQDGLYGDVENIVCAVPFDPTASSLIQGSTALTADENGMVWVQPSSITELAFGGAVDCKGTLRGMEPGMTHGDTAVVTGESIFTQKVVKAEDAWFAKAPSTPGIDVVKYTLDEGAVKGDRNAFKDALDLTPEQGKNGVQVAFDVTNTGDEALKNFSFTDVTHDATTGKVADVKWLDLVQPAVEGEAPAADTAPAADASKSTIVTIGDKSYTVRPLSDLTELAIGQAVLLVGTLTGVEAGTGHSDMATVAAEAVYSGTKVSDSDPWNAKLAAVKTVVPPATPSQDGVPKGALTGDPLSQTAARPWLIGGAASLLLAAGVVAYGIRRRQRFAAGIYDGDFGWGGALI